MYCIVSPYIFSLHMLFYVNVQDNSDDVSHNTCTYAAFHKAV